MSIIHLFGNLAFVLVACSFMVKDILWLRTLSITASLCSIFYNSNVAAKPLLVPISWNLFFISLNIYHVGKIIYGNRKIHLSKKEEELYQLSFQSLNVQEYLKLLSLGTWKSFRAGEVVVTENSNLEELMMIYSGRVDVVVNDQKVNELKDGQFIGEMSFLTEGKTSARVVAQFDTELMSWKQSDLRELKTKNPSLIFSLQGAMARQISLVLAARNLKK